MIKGNLFLLLLFVFATPAHAAPGVNWLQQVTDQVSALMNAKSGQLVDMGSIELNFIAVIALVRMISNWQLSHMVIGWHPVNFRIGDFFYFLLQLLFCAAMLHFYNNPIAGGLNLHQIPEAVGGIIANNLDGSLVDDLAKRISAAIDGTKQPTGLDLLGVVVYGWIMLLMGFMDLIMFAVDAFGFIGYALFSLFGPLMIPLYMTKHFSGKFWGWVDGLIVFGMYRAVSAAITFIWANLLIGFFDNTIGADYSIGHWLAIAATLVMLVGAFAWAMFKVPMMTSWLFGSVGSGAQGATDMFMRGAANALAAVIF